jgi:hypothetical protein
VGAVVPPGDEGADLGVEVADAGEGAAVGVDGRSMIENQTSINRPWGAGSSAGACSGVSGEPVKVFLDAGDDA